MREWIAGLAIVLLSISAAGGASFTLSDAALMSLDWNEQDYYAQPLKARILERRDIPGPGVEFDIFFPSSIGMDRCLTCISSWRGGSGALVGLNVSMYATYDLLFTLKSVNGGQSTNEGDWVTVGAMIGPFGTSSGAYRPFMLDTNPSDWLPDYVAAWTDVKTSLLKIIGFTLGLMPQTNNHWNPQGTTLTLLVQPAPGAVQLFPRPRQVTLEKFARFAAAWLRTECVWPGLCGGGDLNEDGVVNEEDLLLLAEYWLVEMPPAWGL